MSTTIDYYNKNAKAFSDNTREVQFKEVQERFLSMLKHNPKILDFGCGSGRDTKFFLDQGCSVDAIDGSEEMCRLASEYTGIIVKHMYFQDLDVKDKYDGIWACASILHLSMEQLIDVIGKMAKAVKCGGIVYTSFKYGEFSGERNGRFFTDLTEETAKSIIKRIDGLIIVESWISSDVRPGRGEEKWLNLIIQRDK